MRKYLWLILIFAFAVSGWLISYMMKVPIKTDVARSMRHESLINVSGYVIRNETVYATSTGGVVEGAVKDGTRVAKGRKVATVYKNGIDPQIRSELVKLNARIETAEANSVQKEMFVSDVASVEVAVKDKCNELAYVSQSGDLSRVFQIKTDITQLVDRQLVISGGKGVAKDNLDALLTQKNELEARINSDKQDIYAAQSGVYTAAVDGLEKVLAPANIQNLTVSDFNVIKPGMYKAGQTLMPGDGACKTVDNTLWMAGAVVKRLDLQDLQVGKAVKLRFGALGDTTVDGIVEYISPMENDNAVVVVSSTMLVDSIYSVRKVNFDIIKDTYTGLRIPTEAIRVRAEDGETGVFTNVEGMAVFKKINVLYYDDKMAIVKEEQQPRKSLALYDTVVVSGRDIYEGKVLD